MAHFPPWKEEISKTSFRQAVLGEFAATFIFLFSTIGCVVFTQDGGITTARQMQVSLVFGNAITILVFVFAGISGANINPAVSFALAITKTISPIRAVCYAVAQCIGAIAGTAFVRVMTPAMFDQVDGGANEVQRNANSREALGVEFGCTLLLVLTVMAATDQHRAKTNEHIATLAPIVIGMAVTAAHFIAIPVDNCSINPARSFGVAVVSGNFNDHWVFWIGPLLGALAAALIYKYAFRHPDAVAEEERAAAALAAAEKLAEEELAAAAAARGAPAPYAELAVPVASPAGRVTSAVGTGSRLTSPATAAAPTGSSSSSADWPEASSSYRAVSSDAAVWHAESGDLSTADLLRAR